MQSAVQMQSWASKAAAVETPRDGTTTSTRSNHDGIVVDPPLKENQNHNNVNSNKRAVDPPPHVPVRQHLLVGAVLDDLAGEVQDDVGELVARRHYYRNRIHS
jgi:hypothetical protein